MRTSISFGLMAFAPMLVAGQSSSSIAPFGNFSSSAILSSVLPSGTDVSASGSATFLPSTLATAASSTVDASTSGTSSGSSASATASSSGSFFLTCQVQGRNKRQLSGSLFLSFINNRLVARGCTEEPPIAFTITAGELLIGDALAAVTPAVVANPGFGPVSFDATPAATDLTTAFAVTAAGALTWTNAAFLNGQASFCLLGNTLYAAYTLPLSVLPDCVPVTLIPAAAVCPSGSTGTSSGAVATVTATPVINIGIQITIEITLINIIIVNNGTYITTVTTESNTYTNPLTASPSTSVGSAVSNGVTSYFTTTVACGVCQCSGAVPGEITVVQTITACPTCPAGVATTTAPAIPATVIPCSTCKPYVPGTSVYVTGGVPVTTVTGYVPATATVTAGAPGGGAGATGAGGATPSSPSVVVTAGAASLGAGSAFGLIGAFIGLLL